MKEYPVAVAKEEGVEALPDLISGDGTTSAPGPGLTTLRLNKSNWKTDIEEALGNRIGMKPISLVYSE